MKWTLSFRYRNRFLDAWNSERNRACPLFYFFLFNCGNCVNDELYFAINESKHLEPSPKALSLSESLLSTLAQSANSRFCHEKHSGDRRGFCKPLSYIRPFHLLGWQKLSLYVLYIIFSRILN